MSEGGKKDSGELIVQSSRFGDISVAADSVMHFPAGMIGFPQHKNFVMFDHKPPFAWLHSTDDPNLAFVVMDGSQFTDTYDFKAPYNDKDVALSKDDEFAILVIVTVRPDPKMTTANLKAPLFVNIRNRRGVQVIHDDPKFPTRYHLWVEANDAANAAQPSEDVKQAQEKK